MKFSLAIVLLTLSLAVFAKKTKATCSSKDIDLCEELAGISNYF